MKNALLLAPATISCELNNRPFYNHTSSVKDFVEDFAYLNNRLDSKLNTFYFIKKTLFSIKFHLRKNVSLLVKS